MIYNNSSVKGAVFISEQNGFGKAAGGGGYVQSCAVTALFSMLAAQLLMPDLAEYLTVGQQGVGLAAATVLCDMLRYALVLAVPALVYLLLRPRRLVYAPGVLRICPMTALSFSLFVMLCGSYIMWGVRFLLERVSIHYAAPSTEYLSYDSVPYLLLMFISTAVLPAVAEELLFRGLIMRDLLPFGTQKAVFVSALLFGCMHLNPIQIPFAFLSGLALGFFAAATGSLKIPVAAHFLNNALVFFSNVLTRLAPDSAPVVLRCIDGVIFLGGLISCLVLFGKKGLISKKAIKPGAPVPSVYIYAATAFVLSVLLYFRLGD